MFSFIIRSERGSGPPNPPPVAAPLQGVGRRSQSGNRRPRAEDGAMGAASIRARQLGEFDFMLRAGPWRLLALEHDDCVI